MRFIEKEYVAVGRNRCEGLVWQKYSSFLHVVRGFHDQLGSYYILFRTDLYLVG